MRDKTCPKRTDAMRQSVEVTHGIEEEMTGDTLRNKNDGESEKKQIKQRIEKGWKRQEIKRGPEKGRDRNREEWREEI